MFLKVNPGFRLVILCPFEKTGFAPGQTLGEQSACLGSRSSRGPGSGGPAGGRWSAPTLTVPLGSVPAGSSAASSGRVRQLDLSPDVFALGRGLVLRLAPLLLLQPGFSGSLASGRSKTWQHVSGSELES